MLRFGLALVAGILVLSPSEAAVRMCHPTITVGPFTAATEQDAKKQALETWKAEAAKLGERFAGWGTAIDRKLSCQTGDGSKVACTAAASPCTIEQAPNTLKTRSKRIGI